MDQQNIYPCRSHMQTSPALQLTSPVLLPTSRCSQAPLEFSKVLSDSARAFSGAPERTSSYGGGFKTLRYLTDRIVKFWSCWDLYTGLHETSRPDVTLAQRCGKFGVVFSQLWVLAFHNHTAFRVSNSSLLLSEVSLNHNMACIVYLGLSIYICIVYLAAEGTGA